MLGHEVVEQTHTECSRTPWESLGASLVAQAVPAMSRCAHLRSLTKRGDKLGRR